MSEQICDNKSVGVIIENDVGEVAMLERARFPWGYAAPAGHVDDHGSVEQTAVDEVFEELGLIIPASGLTRVIHERRIDNVCRREGGDHHEWTVFLARNATGSIVGAPDETKNSGWYSRTRLQALANNTLRNLIEPNPNNDQVLELVWLNFFAELGYIKNTPV